MKHQAISVALAAVFCLASPAFAHVSVEPAEAAAGSYAKLTFRVPHGCDGSATNSVQIKIPSGVTAVKPQVHPGWEIKITPTDVTWTGGPLPDEFMDEFGLAVKLPDGAGKTIYFGVEQGCIKGSASWTAETSHHGKHDDKGPQPAPSVKLTKAK